MIKNINALIAIVFFLFTAVSFAQEEKKPPEKKAGVAPDSVKMRAPADSTAKNAPAIMANLPVMSQSSLSYNAEGSLFNKKELYKNDYRTTGDFFYIIPFGFQQTLGSGGLPVETMVYGSGYGAVAYMDDGISINSRISNSYNLSDFQSEKIDSIEVYSLPKAFIYTPLSDNSAVNFISKDRIKPKQFSRLRFYQARDKEAFIDFIFAMPFSKNFYFTSEVTNNTINDRYYNSSAGGWRASVKMRYNVSDKVSLLTNYSYVRTVTNLNGGVNLDSLKQMYSSKWETYLYEEKRAFVYYMYRDETVINHALSVRMLSELIENQRTDISLYYQNSLTEFRQNAIPNPADGAIIIADDNKYWAKGTLINHSMRYNFFDLKFIMNYEENSLNTPLLGSERKNNLFSLSAVSTFHLLDSAIHPSVFAKQMHYNSRSYSGIGTDINIKLLNNVYLYAGYSFYKKPYNVYEEYGLSAQGELPLQEVMNFETGIRYYKKEHDIRLGFFNTRDNNYAAPVIIKADGVVENDVSYYYTRKRELNGLNLNINYRSWKILLTTNATSYLNLDEGLVNTPAFTFDGGIFYVDTLFERNLDLKAGFNFKYYAGQNYFYYDFERSLSAQVIKSSLTGESRSIYKTSDVFRVDFFLSGRVQDSAIIYFTFENLFDRDYYTIPYYPALGRNIRFGVSWEFLD